MVACTTIALTFAAIAGCDKPPPTPEPQPQPPGTVETITGRERIGWDQQAGDQIELASFGYALYVDGTRGVVTDVSCANQAGAAGFACAGSLPALANGEHTLQLAAFLIENPDLESARSTSLRVNVVATVPSSLDPFAHDSGAAGASKCPEPCRASTSPEPRRALSRLDRIATGLVDPTDAAFTPDGRLFVAERSGRIRVLHKDSTELRDGSIAADVATDGGNGLLALAIDPRFERTRFVYVLYTARARSNDVVFRVARLREVNDTVAEAAVLVDDVPAPAAHAAATLRFGPDGKLYVAFDAAGDPRRIGDLGSYNGKVLRLNPDGSTPSDQTGGSPVYAYGYRSPRALDWHPATGMLWIAGRGSQDEDRIRVVRGNETRALFAGGDTAIGPVSAMMFYRGDRFADLRGDLLLGNDDAGVVRMRLASTDSTRASRSEPLTAPIGHLRSIIQDPGGAIYVMSADSVFRLRVTPESKR